MYLNEITIIGRITRDIEIKALPNGTNVANFSVATNRTWKDKNSGEKKEEVEFHNVVAFAKQAETIAQYFKKGDEIYVRGRNRTRAWEADGKKLYRTEIMLEQFQFGQKRKDGSGAPSTEARGESGAPDYMDEEINPDDIPF